jgi:hypothetical protein
MKTICRKYRPKHNDLLCPKFCFEQWSSPLHDPPGSLLPQS